MSDFSNAVQRCRPHRELARRAGEPYYFTGRPCKHGHIAKRHTVDASCVECRWVFKEGYREEAAQYARDRRASMTPDEKAEYDARQAEYRRNERLRNPEGVRARERVHGRLKRQRYPERKLAEVRARQAAKMQRTPPWADLQVIRDFYENCPEGHEVDHIVPLRGKTVSGLHVIDNLQYLPKQDNRLKGNRFDDNWQEAA